MRVALYQPDIAANVGAILRLGACLGVPVDIIEPCGFPLGDRDLRRVAMDYLDLAEFVRHDSWEIFYGARSSGRLVLLTTGATLTYTDFAYRPDDTLLLGRESAGVPEDVHKAAEARIRVPLTASARSLNVAMAAAMVLGEALRQNDAFPPTKEEGPR
jgi:tRNA (cytidine/uridine-2'-O-)-methyltransferase